MPPCPGSPESYTLINVKGFFHWRRNRGSLTPVVLNAVMQRRSEAMKALSPAIKALRLLLLPLMAPLRSASLHNDLFAWLQDSWLASGEIGYGNLKNRELHQKYTLDKVLKAPYRCIAVSDMLQVIIPPCSYAVKRQNSLVTDFVLEATLVWEQAGAYYSRTETSLLYKIEEGITSECLFVFEMPSHAAWFLVLKLVCFEGSEWAKHPMHYGMRVLEAGGKDSP